MNHTTSPVLLNSDANPPIPATLSMPTSETTLSGASVMTADPIDGSQAIVVAAKRLSPLVVAAREEAERLRRFPPDLVDRLTAEGLYKMYLPRALGGLELPPATVFEVIETLSLSDGSTGWCLMNANGVSLGAGWLAPEVGRQMFGQVTDFRAAGSLRPQGRARLVDGGYRLTGRWNFASGVLNANWLFCPTLVTDGDKSTARTMLVPADAATVVDNWSVMGLRATGSHDFIIDDLFVPTAHSVAVAEPPIDPGPLYQSRLFLLLVQVLFAANALGIARGAINALLAMASHEASTMSTVTLRDRPAVQARVAQAEAMVNAARCYVIDSLSRLWMMACAKHPDPAWEIAQTRLAIPHAIHESVRAIDLLFHAAGTNAIYTANPLERPFRDIHVATQHAAAFPLHYESAGKVLLGLRPTEPGW
jgi:alkylation response protein AidB-like acyl-CoA dehydrogenase